MSNKRVNNRNNMQFQQSRDQQYAQQVEDDELQQLMRQVVGNRKAEKDYRNIED